MASPHTNLPPDLFPPLTRRDVLAFQFSTWYPIFAPVSIKSTFIRPLSREFRAYLDADGVFLPRGSEDLPVVSTIEDEDGQGDEDEDEDEERQYAFPDLDERIRSVVKEYGAVFPKLNFSSPKDAAWLLPSSAPLKCTAPSDVYMLLKSSDFVTHDLAPSNVFSGCEDDEAGGEEYELELVLRKWYNVERSRELRCFVRDGTLLGITQRDENYYDFLNETESQAKIVNTVSSYWTSQVQPRWTGPASYTFDVLLTRDLTRFHVLDFNPYAARTDSLLFTYEELYALRAAGDGKPVLRVVDSRAHPAATRNAPANQHNMVPIEALSLSSGRGIEDFSKAWEEEVRKGMQESDRGSDSDGDA
ncbi:cytoplasmic protein [Vararia minispora EC-137]|uniref:Cytoplasmic protein n=1 Tax=Vararia minispora EC-137 TaxID=1314806 RepID=A0ACB8QUS2_9AGAM|nr:cytoplasmic protein [Vararia minispora EC-137]